MQKLTFKNSLKTAKGVDMEYGNKINHFHTPPCRNIKRVASRSSVPDQEASQGLGQVHEEGGGGICQALLPETGGLLVRGNVAMFINRSRTFVLQMLMWSK